MNHNIPSTRRDDSDVETIRNQLPDDIAIWDINEFTDVDGVEHYDVVLVRESEGDALLADDVEEIKMVCIGLDEEQDTYPVLTGDGSGIREYDVSWSHSTHDTLNDAIETAIGLLNER